MRSFFINFRKILKIIRVLPKRTQTFIALLIPLMLLCGIGEMISLAALIPFLQILSNPERISNFTYLFRGFLNNLILSNQQLLVIVTSLFILIALFSALLRLLNQKIISKLTAKLGTEISTISFSRILGMDYQEYILSSNSNNINILMDDTSQSVQAINSFLNFLTNFITIFFIALTLFIRDFKSTFTISIFFIFFYSLIIIFTKNNLIKNGRISKLERTKSLKILNDSLGGFREVLLEKTQNFYIRRFWKTNFKYRDAQTQTQFLASFPKFVLEMISISCIALYALIIAISIQNSEDLFSEIAFIAFAAAKILPMFQNLFNSYAQVQARIVSVEEIISIISNKNKGKFNKDVLLNEKISIKDTKKVRDLKLKSITFSNVSFKYPESDKFALNTINMEIKGGETIGIIGDSGSGKSTFIDLFIGLLKPSCGNIKYEYYLGRDYFESKDPLIVQENLSHVPQNIFIADTTIAQNIAFGIPESEINEDSLIKAASYASILEFIDSLPKSFNTRVGERGIMLSGGQMQRIGIARSLYKSAEITILDESTSALDKANEKNILNRLTKINKNKTMVIISHHKEALLYCDKVYIFSNGIIKKEILSKDLGMKLLDLYLKEKN